MDLRRPNLKEDDEEALLRAQEEFLAKKDPKLSVHLDLSKRAEKRKSDSDDQGLGSCRESVVSKGEENHSPTRAEKDITRMEVEPPAGMAVGELPAKKSKFARERQQGGLLGSQAPGIREDVLQKHQKTFGSLQIIERDTSRISAQRPQISAQPFPVAERIDASQLQGRKAGQRGQSLFAQMNRLGKKTAGTAVAESAMETGEAAADAKASGTSCIVTGSGLSASFGVEEARKIHMENAEKLAAMTQEEILAEQQKLLQEIGTRDPKLLEFLKSRRKGAAAEAKSEKQQGKKSVRFESTAKPSSNAMEEDGEVDVPFQVKGEWLHMDKVEKDKLAWMKDLRYPSAHVAESTPARFDFHGNVMPADEDVPVNLGLHHHGEEPERPGYTLQELFHLAHSSNVQQRTLAISTLARILAKAKEGSYRELLQKGVLPAVTSAGIVFLLRAALDESADSLQSAALAALASFITSPGDEACLDHTFGWVHGHVAPTLCPAPLPDTEEEEEADKPAETDAMVAARDVVFALVSRMSLLQRLLYIMKHRSPPAPSVLSCLAILTRVARHSPALAYEIMHCPGLVDFIFDNFLPLSWNPIEPDAPVCSVQGLPLPAAMRLVSAICQAGRNMAAILVDRFKLGDRILLYLSNESGQLPLKAGEAMLLQTESYRTWTICLGYGLTSDIYSPLYGKLAAELRQMRGVLPCLQPDPSLLLRQVAMVTALDMAVHVAASAKPGASLQAAGDAGQQGEAVTWQAVEHLAQQVQGLTVSLLTDLTSNHQHQKRNLQVLTACVKFLGSFYSRISSQADYDPVRVLTQVETFFNDVIKTFWNSLGFRSVMLTLSQHSNLLSPPDCRNQELDASVGGLGGSVPGSDCLLPVLRCHSPFGLLTALLRLLLQLCRLHKGILPAVQMLLVEDAELQSYLRKLAQNRASPLHDNHFSLHENLLQFYLLQLCALRPCRETEGASCLHTVSLLLMQRLPRSLAHLRRILLSSVVFSRDLIEGDSSLEAARECMSGLSLSSRPGEEGDALPSNSQLLQQALDSIPSIRTVYLAFLSPPQSAADTSRHQLEQDVDAVDSLVMAGARDAALPKDWVFLPIIDLYSSSLSQTAEQDRRPSEQVVRSVLQWAFLLETRAYSVVTTLSPVLTLTRLLCSFLAGPDFFLDPTVRGLLWGFLCRFSEPRFLAKLDFAEPVPGIASFYDLYVSLLQQYQAVSYGDHVFCGYVLLPLMQSQSVQLRLAVWGEHAAVLRSLSVPLDKLPIPLESFLQPEETDEELLSLYLRFLAGCGGLLQRPPSWPVLVAVHHLNRFLFLETESSARTELWRRLLDLPHPEGRNSIVGRVILYKTVNLSLTESCGLEMYGSGQLPRNRAHTLTTMLRLVDYKGQDFQ